jgi:flagellar basal body rod protein FlgG
MPGSTYIALSGLRARMDQLDQLASDIANIGTAGYKGAHDVQAASERPVSSFADVLQTAIDTTSDGQALDMRAGAIAPTGRPLDVALDGPGFFTVSTPGGVRYTRNGHFSRSTSGTLTTDDGNPLLDPDGQPITLGDGDVRIDNDGTVWSGTQQSGKLAVVGFGQPSAMVSTGPSLFSAPGQKAQAIETPTMHGGSLEQSNVSMADRIAELTSVSRGFEAMQKTMSVMLNDVDARAIDVLGRR